ncbi:HlyD family efflux transporter periplasmic adaptor subunit [Streptomyces sp. NPDC058691]|uniref:HlyD family efflux transporter periplasmic adaptor subunit n=1 Tax=Streptomyces sp. NPDC058691 TaxID=3346601 RepID=UPI0036628B14
MEFRQKALTKLQSPEELDLPVRFAKPRGLLVMSVTIAVAAAAAFWAVTGSVASKMNAPGILTHGQGSYVLQSPVAGQVTRVFAEEGRRLAADAPLLKVHTPEGDTLIRTVAAGRVTALAATIGTVVTVGTDVAAVERVAHADDPLTATLYIPAGSASSVPVGAAVDLTVESVSQQRYGVLRGHVRAVGRTVQTTRQISAYLGDGQLAQAFARGGRPVAVLVRMDTSRRTESGYAWSSSDGPPYALDSMTLAGGAVHLAAQRPLDWLLP